MLYLKARAKVNLFLHCTAKLANGYHNLQSLVAFCDIYDELKIKKSHTYELSINGDFAKNIGDIANNTITKTFHLFKETFDLKGGIKIQLTKNIPSGAGLGGGSSDASCVILALIKLFNLKIKYEQLLDLALRIGSDVPVCLHQKISFMQGQGEQITKQAHIKKIPIILINPYIHLSTAQIFSEFAKLQQFSQPINFNLVDNSPANLIQYLQQQKNDLLPVAKQLSSQIADILEVLKITSAKYSSMSGSGSTCFGLYDDFKSLNNALHIIHKHFPKYWIKASYLR